MYAKIIPFRAIQAQFNKGSIHSSIKAYLMSKVGADTRRTKLAWHELKSLFFITILKHTGFKIASGDQLHQQAQ